VIIFVGRYNAAGRYGVLHDKIGYGIGDFLFLLLFLGSVANATECRKIGR
jgi:hypothetical protein